MTYLDFERLGALDPQAFQVQRPYPWINPEGLLTEAGYRRLLETLPDVSLFKSSFARKRLHGQQNHDRYVLDYRDDLDIGQPWKDFVTEIRGGEYKDFLRRLLGARSLDLSLHWHYTPNGCSVSPHCDAKRKCGSHIFYFNTADDWEAAWGGETLILDDGGRFDPASAPAFNDFERSHASETLGNYSLLFARKERSWHGVREIRCPEGCLRKVFIVVINRVTPLLRARRLVGNLPTGY